MLKVFKKGIGFSKYLARYSLLLARSRRESAKNIFTEIYRKNIWSNPETLSGDSSTVEFTEKMRVELHELLKEFEIKSILDIPCGDFNWMKEMALDGITYTGADIVEELIEENIEKHADSNKSFTVLDITVDKLPKVDLIFCRDCLVHLSNENVLKALENIRSSGAEYLLMTTFTDAKKNKNIVNGAWRAINFSIAPFNLSSPLQVINEGFDMRMGRYPDKCLGLWKVKDLFKVKVSK